MQLKPAHRRLLQEITLTGQNVLRGDDLEGGQPLQRGDISYFSLLLMMTALAHAEFGTFMDHYAPAMVSRSLMMIIMSSNLKLEGSFRKTNTSHQTISKMLRARTGR